MTHYVASHTAVGRLASRRHILFAAWFALRTSNISWVLPFAAPCWSAHLVGLVHHTDGERECAYDRNSDVGRLDRALDEAIAKNWTIVDTKQDWKVIDPFQK